MTRTVLTDDQLAAIAWSDPNERTVDFAHRIGAPATVVNSARRRIQAAGGWWCALRLTRCTVCDGPLLGRTKARPRQIHPGCAQQRQSLDRTAAKQRDQAITRERAHQADLPWSPEEDARLLAPHDRADRELALELGRSLLAVQARRTYLRKLARVGRVPRERATTRGAPNAGTGTRTRRLPPVSETLRDTGLLTITAAAQRAEVSVHYLRYWIRKHQVRTRRIGYERHLKPEDLAAIQEEMHLGKVIPVWRQDKPHAGTRLRQLREAAGLTQLDLAAAIGISHEGLSLLEVGKRSPQAETVRALARALRVEPDHFIRHTPIGLSLMTVAEAASRLNVPPSRVQTWLKQGILEGSKVSGQWRVATVVVDELARSGRLRGRSGRLDPRYHG